MRWRLSPPVTPGVTVLFALAACANPFELGGSMAARLVGAWNLINSDGALVPGTQLVFEPPSRGTESTAYGECSKTTVSSGVDQAPHVRECTYEIHGESVTVEFAAYNPRYTVTVYGDELTLWGPPCDMWAVVCSRHRERYRRANP